jgi:hypothetical protein
LRFLDVHRIGGLTRREFRQGGAAQFQPHHGATGGKKLLRQPFWTPYFHDLRADDIAPPFTSSFHAPKMELDGIENGARRCSIFGATFRLSPKRVFTQENMAFLNATPPINKAMRQRNLC